MHIMTGDGILGPRDTELDLNPLPPTINLWAPWWERQRRPKFPPNTVLFGSCFPLSMGVCYPAHHKLTKICIWPWALKLIFVATRKICLIEGQIPQLFPLPQTCWISEPCSQPTVRIHVLCCWGTQWINQLIQLYSFSIAAQWIHIITRLPASNNTNSFS